MALRSSGPRYLKLGQADLAFADYDLALRLDGPRAVRIRLPANLPYGLSMSKVVE
jgi:cytochrome c-type biogenesis protein CcmH/NrfG